MKKNDRDHKVFCAFFTGFSVLLALCGALCVVLTAVELVGGGWKSDAPPADIRPDMRSLAPSFVCIAGLLQLLAGITGVRAAAKPEKSLGALVADVFAALFWVAAALFTLQYRERLAPYYLPVVLAAGPGLTLAFLAPAFRKKSLAPPSRDRAPQLPKL